MWLVHVLLESQPFVSVMYTALACCNAHPMNFDRQAPTRACCMKTQRSTERFTNSHKVAFAFSALTMFLRCR